jgi:hypothetical protein
MADWAKIKFFWDTMLGAVDSTLAADSTESTGDFNVDYIFNMLETNMWKSANTTDPQYITFDAGVGNTKSADFLAIIGHNLNTISATVTLQYSTDNFSGDINDIFSAEMPSADTVFLKEFVTQDKRYWRLKISGAPSAVPFLTICIWGNKTELDFAELNTDPHAQTAKANINMTQGGVIAGIHTKFIERSLVLRFNGVSVPNGWEADSDNIYTKIFDWWNTSGLKNFFVAWETANRPDDVYLMHPDPTFNNPLVRGGVYRDVTINLKGRLE